MNSTGDAKAGLRCFAGIEDKSVDELANTDGRDVLDQALATALVKARHGDLGMELAIEEESMANRGQPMRGRQMAKRITEWFAPDARNRGLYSSEDLMAVALKKDELAIFKARWENTLVGLRAAPSEDIKLALFLKQLRKSKRMRTQIEAWERLPPSLTTYGWLHGALSRDISNARDRRHRQETQAALGKKGAAVLDMPEEDEDEEEAEEEE